MTRDKNPRPTESTHDHRDEEASAYTRRGFLGKVAVTGIVGLAGPAVTEAAAAPGDIVVEGDGPGRHQYSIRGDDGAHFEHTSEADPYPENERWAADDINLGRTAIEGNVWDSGVDSYDYMPGNVRSLSADGQLTFMFDSNLTSATDESRIFVYGNGSGGSTYTIAAVQTESEKFADPNDNVEDSAIEGYIQDDGKDSYTYKTEDAVVIEVDGNVNMLFKPIDYA